MDDVQRKQFERYLAIREQQRQDRLDEMVAALTEREFQLIKEAAVMGYVQGRRSGGTEETPFPKDGEIVSMVLLCADSVNDLYPLLFSLGRPIICDCCRQQRTSLPYGHDAHDDSGDHWDYCQECHDTGCDLETCSL